MVKITTYAVLTDAAMLVVIGAEGPEELNASLCGDIWKRVEVFEGPALNTKYAFAGLAVYIDYNYKMQLDELHESPVEIVKLYPAKNITLEKINSEIEKMCAVKPRASDRSGARGRGRCDM